MTFHLAGTKPYLKTVSLRELILCGLMLLGLAAQCEAASWEQALTLYRTGKYRQCAEYVAQAIESGEHSESWRLLKVDAHMAVGDYDGALETLELARRRYYSSIQMRWAASRVCQAAGLDQQAEQLLLEIGVLVERSPWTYSDATDRITLGKFFLSQGADARRVLTLFYDRAKKSEPNSSDAFIAAGQLALEKHDYQLAAKEFEQALKLDAKNPDVLLGLALSFEPSDSERSTNYLQQALAINPSHTDSLIFAAEEKIDSEEYDQANQLLEQTLAVNPELPDAWALLGVIAHLKADHEREGFCRRVALGWWPLNPRVDWLIGRQLSQHYRFHDGAIHQRRALKMDPKYLPAKFQLSQDLLRLGQEDEGWQLAADVFAEDAYNVVAHNLVQLQERIEQFRTLEAPNLILRMDAREADIYGARVLALLQRVNEEMTRKYQYQPPQPVLVELFPAQQDFAIRTFGLPGGEGFLGVCFGPVVTANSAAAQGASLSNWESVLWHEYCHVITLGKTQNRIPRWLSEGLSVYEERQADPAWGQHMTPTYRRMIMDGELTPLSKLSTAFLQPDSPMHLQFAYFEASLVVEFLVERFGFESIVRTLDDLGQGLLLEDALTRHTAPLAFLDEQFASYARQKAEAFAPKLDWSQPDSAQALAQGDGIDGWLKDHPDSYFAREFLAEQCIEVEDWPKAREILEQLVSDCPEFANRESPYPKLALVCRKMADTQRERAVLEQWVQRDGDALEAVKRLIELASEQQDWSALREFANRGLALNPLDPEMHRHLAVAAGHLSDREASISAYGALLALGPVDPADIHFQLAQILEQRGDKEAARRHVLQSLAEAPRFRAAHKLLLRLTATATATANDEPSTGEPINNERVTNESVVEPAPAEVAP